MINVNQITAQLARMPDQALQQYASMHKNDPYTVSLALAESNRRKQMRTAAQGQQGEQPKVVDQELSQMAAPQAMPEDTGIGTLPAPNMQGMADGGIIAFADEGAVVDPDALSYGEQMSNAFGFLFGDIPKHLVSAPGYGFNRPSKPGDTPTVAPSAVKDIPYTGTGVPSAAAAKLRSGASPGINTLIPGAGAPPAPRAPVAPVSAALSYADRMKAGMGTGEAVDPFEARRIAATAAEKAGAEEGLAKTKKELEEETAGLYKGQEERIGKRETALEKSKDVNTGLAFLEAGLAMMQSRGPGLSGIAQGAGVGVKSYAAGIKDIKSAQDKLDEARDRMEELRQNKGMMDKREIRAEEKGIREIVNRGNKEALAGAEKAYGLKREDVRAAVTSDIAVSEAAKTRATQLQAAGIAAAPGLERNKMVRASMDTQAKIRKDYDALQSQVTSALGKDPTYMMAPPAQQAQIRTARLREALLNNPFLSQYAAGVGFTSGAGGSAGTVRELDEAE